MYVCKIKVIPFCIREKKEIQQCPGTKASYSLGQHIPRQWENEEYIQN
jgi:hypothetical protein